jgi:hypothetical protein
MLFCDRVFNCWAREVHDCLNYLENPLPPEKKSNKNSRFITLFLLELITVYWNCLLVCMKHG